MCFCASSRNLLWSRGRDDECDQKGILHQTNAPMMNISDSTQWIENMEYVSTRILELFKKNLLFLNMHKIRIKKTYFYNKIMDKL